MSKTDFLTKQNVSLLWEVIMDNDFMKNKPPTEISQIIDIFNVNLKKFHDSTNNNNLTELNKNYITVMMNFINKNFNKPTPTPPNEKKLVTYEELQNDRLSKFEKDFNIDEVRSLLSGTPGIELKDNTQEFDYPMPLYAQGKDAVFVGRIRRDLSQQNTINMWIVADNLRKGAATNAVQIAQLLVDKGLV
jgi:aspartate-semialdehyde dehydrogenase